jgi:hypothetical protein
MKDLHALLTLVVVVVLSLWVGEGWCGMGAACRYFHNDDPPPGRIEMPRDGQTKEPCFLFESYPSSIPNALHVRFRHHSAYAGYIN